MNVISVAKMHDDGCKILFGDHITIIRDNISLCIGRNHQGSFKLFPGLFGPEADTTIILELKRMITKVKHDRNVVMCHKRLAHMKLPNIHNLINSHYMYDMKMVKKMKCVDCEGLKPTLIP